MTPGHTKFQGMGVPRRQARKRSASRLCDRSDAGQNTSEVVSSDRSGSVVLGRDGDFDRSEAVSLDAANRVRRSGKEQALTDLLTFYADNPGASYRVAGEAVDRSKSWVVGAVAELEAAGRIRRNGSGIEVL